MPKHTWEKARVTHITEVTANTRRYVLEVLGDAPFRFTPGQFVTVDLPIGETAAARQRSYSIANPPEGRLIELIIVHLEGGSGSGYFFESVKPGTIINFRGPLGKFILQEPIKIPACFICTGTGIAPFRSMLLDLRRRVMNHPGIHVIFGTRTTADILFYNEMANLAKLWPNFKYDVALSREDRKEPGFHQGYVHSIYEQAYANIDHPINFYLCGWPDMVKEARGRLAEMGVPKERILLEIYS